ncbi:MAG: NAD-dependent epimerase/dehydratase family protein [Gammaproteobacteria bacterium]|nr:NAD-dependent epimerase/dehydratase family protein [Gammaproteobacteria bacterium]
MSATAKTVLVTGASGFIGQALVGALERQGYAVRAIGRTPVAGVAWRHGDLADPGSLRDCCAGVEAVCHLAGAAHVQAPRAVHEKLTVMGTQALLAEARAADVRSFVFVSSIKAVCSTDDYAQTRRAAETLVLAEPTLVGHVVRPALVYGPGMKGNLARLLVWAARPVPLPIPKGLALRSLIHRDDVAAVIVALLARTERSPPWVVSDGQAYTLWDIYAEMRRACGRRIVPLHLPPVCLSGLASLGDRLGRWWHRELPFDSQALRPLLESCYVEDRSVWDALHLTPRWTLAQALAVMAGGRP